tara:strand:- start:87 stop:1445 length:1359 start_codon:yes stop_codon:yes gene_type:complete
MSEIKVNKISPRTNCGTVTLGDSGDSFVVPAGATITNNGTQTGFGRTGTVDWDTTPKTATFTAVSGDGFFANTTASAFNMNLPAGVAGAIVSVADYAGTWQNNNLTVVPNGTDKIGGVNANSLLSTEGQSVTFVFVDSTQGWVNVQDSTSNARGNQFIIATGGNTVTECGNDKIHTFTSPGTFTVSQVHPCAANNLVSYMVVAGGGGGGGWYYGGGGGAGGFRETKSPVTPYTASPLCGHGTPGNRITVTATAFPIAVGGGGAGGATSQTRGTAGVASTFSTISSAGGGGGGSYGPQIAGGDGGSGGGGGTFPNSSGSAGSGNTPSTTPPQGNSGGDGSAPNSISGGGGGAGETGNTDGVGFGGDGVATSINGTPTTRAGGGGGTGQGPITTIQPGGDGGGGASGRYNPFSAAVAGTDNTGGGGGGGTHCGNPICAGANGGSGIVIIRYKFK